MRDAEARLDAKPYASGLDWQSVIADALAARGVTVAATCRTPGCRASCGRWPGTGSGCVR